ncbi:transposable element Tcb2 transposase [Trichonephila clavipes]|nr:transposable element Tcb2 transposase [Trichonephila clavipes]
MIFRRDESRFSLECDIRRVLACRERGTRNNPTFVQDRSPYRRDDLMVWTGINIDGCINLHIIRIANLTTQRYAGEILIHHVVPCAAAIGDFFISMQDNSKPHSTHFVKNFLEAEAIQRIELSACCPDVNPIKHVWDTLGRVAARTSLMLLSKSWRSYLVKGGTVFPKVSSMTTSHPC